VAKAVSRKVEPVAARPKADTASREENASKYQDREIAIQSDVTALCTALFGWPASLRKPALDSLATARGAFKVDKSDVVTSLTRARKDPRQYFD
jgi:hypothetical protein